MGLGFSQQLLSMPGPAGQSCPVREEVFHEPRKNKQSEPHLMEDVCSGFELWDLRVQIPALTVTGFIGFVVVVCLFACFFFSSSFRNMLL